MMDRVRDDLFFGDIYDAVDHDSYRRNDIDAVVKLCGRRSPNLLSWGCSLVRLIHGGEDISSR